MNDNFSTVLNDALEKEFSWLEGFENPDEGYTFSKKFKTNMNKTFSMSEYTYVSVGRRRIRRSLIAVLVALVVFIATGCAASYLIITWNETQNDSQGTMDVTFDIKNNSPGKTEFQCIAPETPEGYSVTSEFQDTTTYYLEYSDGKDNTIFYAQDSGVANMGLSIDNENAEFSETVINGYKGYSYKKEGVSELIWTDGIYLYTLQGTCDMKVLEKMSRGIVAAH